MEGLKLEDLNFEGEEAAFDVFAEEKPEEEVTAEGSQPSLNEIDNNKKPDSENPSDSESVASGDDNNNQGQADKANTSDGDADSSSPTTNDSEQLYSTLATHLIAKGALSDLDPSTIKNVDDLNAAIEKEATSRLDSKQKAIEQAMNVGAPTTEVAKSVDFINQLNELEDATVIDPGNDGLRLNLIAQDFINKGYSPERASTMAQRSVDIGAGVEDAKFALESIKQYEQKKYEGLIEDAKLEEQKSLDDIKDYLSSEKGTLADIKLTGDQQEDIFTQMTTDVGNKRSKFIEYQVNNPVQSRVKLETLYYLTKEFTDFSVFSAGAQTKASNELEDLLRGANFTADGKINTEVKDKRSSFGLKDLKDLEIDS